MNDRASRPRSTVAPATRKVPPGRPVGPAPLVVTLVATAFLALSCATPPPDPQPVTDHPDPGWPMRLVEPEPDFELPEPFVRLVDLARLRIGMTKAEVLEIFPDPYEIKLRQGDEFWQYGFAELIFRDGRLRDWFDL